MPELLEFLAGGVTIAYLVGAAFFLRFWRKTGDRLFASFALAFVVLAFARLFVSLVGDEDERTTLAYTLRVVAHLVIVYAIVGKNLWRSRAGRPPT